MAKKTAVKVPAAPVEVLDADVPEVALVLTESEGLVTWLQGLAAFFRTAKQIERAAIVRRDRVLALPVPTSKSEDAVMRQEVLIAREERKTALAHWDPITGLLSKLHKRATAGRALATGPLEEAERFATGQHEAFERAETRRAREEQDRIRREEEQRAEAERAKALAEFEAAALAAEESSPDLSAREQKFVEAVFRLGPGGEIRALREAGFTDVTMARAGRLMGSDKIIAALIAKRKAHTMRTQIEVMKEIAPAVDEARIAAAAPNLNTGDSHTWTAIVVDPTALRDAAFEQPVLGIPRELFVVDTAALNRYARSLGQNIERWPGVKAKRNTTVR